ncbi:MAG: hypothetical protein R3A12_13840 [Ignavibacteria bacterium]
MQGNKLLKTSFTCIDFSASPTPASVAVPIFALEILKAEPERINLIRNAEKMRNGFKEMGFRVIDSRTAIVPVVLGEDRLVFMFWRKL